MMTHEHATTHASLFSALRATGKAAATLKRVVLGDEIQEQLSGLWSELSTDVLEVYTPDESGRLFMRYVPGCYLWLCLSSHRVFLATAQDAEDWHVALVA